MIGGEQFLCFWYPPPILHPDYYYVSIRLNRLRNQAIVNRLRKRYVSRNEAPSQHETRSGDFTVT
jgi:hypothetical protein